MVIARGYSNSCRDEQDGRALYSPNANRFDGKRCELLSRFITRTWTGEGGRG